MGRLTRFCLRILLSWLNLVLASGQQLALTASAPFRMILSPTSLELKSAALKLIKEAAREQVLEYSSSASSPDGQNNETEATTAAMVASMEIVFQSVEILPDILATRISFFALATYRASVSGEVIAKTGRQTNLNTIVEQAFSTTDRRMLFLQRIRQQVSNSNNETTNQAATTEQLQILESLVVVSVLPVAAVEPGTIALDGRTKLLSAVDIILIAISATILIGILWILWEYYKDRGFIKNQSRRVYNSRGPSLFAIPRAYFEESFNFDSEEPGLKSESLSASLDKSRSSAYDCSPILELQNMVIEPSPSISSTIASSMIIYSEEESSPSFSLSDSTAAVFATGMRPPRSLPEPRNLLPPYLSDDDEEVVSDFGNNWFRKGAYYFPHRRATNRNDVGQDGKDGESAGGDDNSSDDDVFFVARESSNHSPSHCSLEYSISEWMSTIQVTSPENSMTVSVLRAGSGSLLKENGQADRSARSHTVASLLELSSLEQKSSDHSAASSSDSDDSISTVYDEDDEKKSARP